MKGMFFHILNSIGLTGIGKFDWQGANIQGSIASNSIRGSEIEETKKENRSENPLRQSLNDNNPTSKLDNNEAIVQFRPISNKQSKSNVLKYSNKAVK
jgi:hypothetical protein